MEKRNSNIKKLLEMQWNFLAHIGVHDIEENAICDNLINNAIFDMRYDVLGV